MAKRTTAAKKKFQFSVDDKQSVVTFGDAIVEVSSDGKKVSAYAPNGFEVKAAVATDAAAEGKKVSLSVDFNAKAIVLNGVTVEQAADGHLVITAPGGTVVNKSPAKAVLEVGDKMADGTIYAGISPDTKLPMYAAPKDASWMMDYPDALSYAKDLEVDGKKGFRVPSRAELDVLYKNSDKGALKGTFNLSSAHPPESYYWSSTPWCDNNAWQKRFSDGTTNDVNMKSNKAAVRCIR